MGKTKYEAIDEGTLVHVNRSVITWFYWWYDQFRRRYFADIISLVYAFKPEGGRLVTIPVTLSMTTTNIPCMTG